MVNTLSGSAQFSATPTTSTPSIASVVTTGTPRTVLASARGARRSRAMPATTRPAPKRSALMAESAAVITTTFSSAAAQFTPRVEKICTNGDSSPVICCQGVSSRITPIAST